MHKILLLRSAVLCSSVLQERVIHYAYALVCAFYSKALIIMLFFFSFIQPTPLCFCIVFMKLVRH